MNKVSLRMKLSEFINTDYEPIIMEYIDVCHKRQPFFLNFWCNEGEIDVDTIQRFADEHKSKLHIRTVIKSTLVLGPHEFVWYDIIRKEDIQNHVSMAESIFDRVQDTQMQKVKFLFIRLNLI